MDDPMAEWTRVKWSEARQVLDILDHPDATAEVGSRPPAAYFEQLRQGGRQALAVRFLSQALPRLEAVGWATRTVRDLAPEGDRSSPEARALRSALLWVSDPTEARRRLAFEAASAARATTPEYLAAMAAFFSGGSIAPEGVQPLMPARDAAGRFAAVAVISAVSRAADRVRAMDLALDMGAWVARHGLEPAAA